MSTGSEPPASPSTHGKLRAVLVALALAAAFAVLPRLARTRERFMPEAPNFEAPVIANGDRLPTDAGRADIFELSSVKGQTVVLDFWASWCGPCQAESPIVNAIAERYRERGLAVIGVNTSDKASLAEWFVRSKGLTFPVVFDENGDIAGRFGVYNLPTLIVISKTGKIVAVRQGITSDRALDEIVRRYL